MKDTPWTDMRAFTARTVIGGCGIYLLLTACGSWGGSPTAPESPPPPGATVTITGGAVVPSAIDLPAGGRLTIVNRDAVSHDMRSDPHPADDACPELNAIGLLAPGQRRTGGPIGGARTCRMHDDLRPVDASLHLRIVVR